MKKFEIGTKYYNTAHCDHNCVFEFEIKSRTAKTMMVKEKYDKEFKRVRISLLDGNEIAKLDGVYIRANRTDRPLKDWEK